jgi:hypothetical protein
MTFGLDESLPVSKSAGFVNSVVAWRGAAIAAIVGPQECLSGRSRRGPVHRR